MEITVVQARERLNLMAELNQTGAGRWFIGLTDDQPTEDFRTAMQAEPRMYSTDEAQQALKRAIELCIEKKMHSCGDILLIEAPLDVLPNDRWLELKPDLAGLAGVLSFP